MRRFFLASVAIFTTISVGLATAGEVCEPIPPQEWTGTLQAPFAGGWLSITTFEEGGCSWNGLDALNGFDAFIWDVKEHAGLPVTVETVSSDTPLAGGQGFFFNDRCERSSAYGPVLDDAPVTVVVPEEAQWMVAYALQYSTATLELRMKSAGATCDDTSTDPPDKKKKKKKKKGKRG